MLGRYDIEGDAERAMAVLRQGGIAIMPMDVGYSLIGGSEAALARIFETKGRGKDKLNAMVGDQAIHEAIHQVDQRAMDVVQAITADADLPLGVIAPCDLSHPLLNVIGLDGSNKDGTVALLMNAYCSYSTPEYHEMKSSLMYAVPTREPVSIMIKFIDSTWRMVM